MHLNALSEYVIMFIQLNVAQVQAVEIPRTLVSLRKSAISIFPSGDHPAPL